MGARLSWFLLFVHSILLLPVVVPALQVKAVADLRERAELLLDPAAGPESIAFDVDGGGPYTGVSDGSILKWDAETRRWRQFAVPPRHQGDLCSSPYQPLMENVCGRPLGLQFESASGNLYIADAYFGLMKVGASGGTAQQVATEAEGQPFFFTNGVDIDQRGGNVYFTDSSTRFHRRDFLMTILTEDATGRLMSYDPRTREVKVLLRGLAFPNGVAMAQDGESLLLAETTNRRVLRYWLRGPDAGKVDVFAELFGYPDNIKRTLGGDFWVALGMGRNFGGAAPVMCPVAMRLTGNGTVAEVVEDCTAPGEISEVEERNGTLWFGSVTRPYVELFQQ